MKFTTIIVSALATLVAAAPAPADKAVEKRVSFDANIFNQFGGQNFAYVANINNFNFQLLQQLAQQQNFDILAFQGIFQQNAQFDVANLLAFQQLHTITQLAQLGVFNGFDLGGLNLGGFGLGAGAFQLGVLQNGIGNFGLNTLIQGNQLNTIQQITSKLLPVGGVFGSGISGVSSGNAFSGGNVLSGVPSSGFAQVSSGVPSTGFTQVSSGGAVAAPSNPNSVTAEEQEAQEGASNLL
ncbi:hypothetical protein QBC39DRAFT_408284 [Podospora conica]|nr:hypothetical protein QBC39DRAFT_408284 [Schizothecium conicum]